MCIRDRPLALGKPGSGYPHYWSVYAWIHGETAQKGPITDHSKFAVSLAEFLIALQSIDSTHGPLPDEHNFYRGGPMKIYDPEIRQASVLLKGKIDTKSVLEICGT